MLGSSSGQDERFSFSKHGFDYHTEYINYAIVGEWLSQWSAKPYNRQFESDQWLGDKNKSCSKI